MSTKECISKQPLLADPYEDLFVYVDQSLIPDAGQGLFAKVDIEAATVISFYNLFILHFYFTIFLQFVIFNLFTLKECIVHDA